MLHIHLVDALLYELKYKAESVAVKEDLKFQLSYFLSASQCWDDFEVSLALSLPSGLCTPRSCDTSISSF